MKPKLIYISPWNSAFVKKDISFLSKKHQILTYNQQWNRKAILPILFLRQSLWLLKKIRRVESIVIMFGGYHSLIPSLFGHLFRRKTFIILGGTECVSLPLYNYGSLRKTIMRKAIKWSFQFCDCLLPVDESLAYSKNLYINNPEFASQGFKHHFKKLKTPYEVIHNGFESIEIRSADKVSNTVITVADIKDKTRFYLKGIDKIIMLANTLPNVRFKIVGISKAMQQLHTLPENIEAFDFLPFEDFKQHLIDSQFYAQISISEGFPNALCEAMMYECIPIGSAVGAIPEIINDTGFIIKNCTDEKIRIAFEEAIDLSNDAKEKLGKSARERVVENYSLKKREDAFERILS